MYVRPPQSGSRVSIRKPASTKVRIVPSGSEPCSGPRCHARLPGGEVDHRQAAARAKRAPELGGERPGSLDVVE